jgi:ribosomal protein S18 acetylase RimI-like enzyme
MDPADVAAAWHGSLGAPPKDARNRVLVALERAVVRGFAVTQPSPDPDADPVADGEITDLTVDPEHSREGHGSRLVHAAVDTLRADRFTRALVWLSSTDDVRRAFLTDAGFEPDGAHRELDLHGDGSVTIKQVRLHASL